VEKLPKFFGEIEEKIENGQVEKKSAEQLQHSVNSTSENEMQWHVLEAMGVWVFEFEIYMDLFNCLIILGFVCHDHNIFQNMVGRKRERPQFNI
jgi:hypothetical protein